MERFKVLVATFLFAFCSFQFTLDSSARNCRINGTKIGDGINTCGVIKNKLTGKGIPGVPVTDGFTFTVTDKHGVYQMAANNNCRTIYYSLPAEYAVSFDAETHLPLFYSVEPFDSTKLNRFDFELSPRESAENDFTYVAMGDPQSARMSDAERFVNETLPDLQKTLIDNQSSGKYDNAYVFIMGDVVYDTPLMWDPMKTAMSGFRDSHGFVPIFNGIGNHDHDAGASSQYGAVTNYISHFGPTDYSLNIGKVHIVTMESVICKSSNGDSWAYDSGFTDEQLEWLKEDLSYVADKEDKMIILNTHIPFREGAKRGGGLINKNKHYADILRLLTEFHEAHIFAGHRHFTQNWVHADYVCKGGTPIYEHLLGGACGAFWTCNSNLDGSPNSYSIYEVEGNSIVNWVSKAVGGDKDFQLRVYDGNQVYTGSKGYEFSWYGGCVAGPSVVKAKGYEPLKGCFVVELWNDDDTYWSVELLQDGRKVADLQRVPVGKCSNACMSSYFYNELNKSGWEWSIYENGHYWYYRPESEMPAAEQNWEIRATQRIPSSGIVNVYKSNVMQTDYKGL